jgi:hypothetical protein
LRHDRTTRKHINTPSRFDPDFMAEIEAAIAAERCAQRRSDSQAARLLQILDEIAKDEDERGEG